jgi:hypothetical protein
MISEAFAKLSKLAIDAGKLGATNVFAYFSGHGASRKNSDGINNLHIACPSVMS